MMQSFDTILEHMAAIHQAKNADYGSSYELSAQLLGRPVVEGLLTRMCDKLARACRLAQGQDPQVKDEALADTLLDLANYAVLAVLALENKTPAGGPRVGALPELSGTKPSSGSISSKKLNPGGNRG
jgi:hypothetical protein